MNIEIKDHLGTLRDLLTAHIQDLQEELRVAANLRHGLVQDGVTNDVGARGEWTDLERESEREASEDLQLCEEALRRIELGGYGNCRDCNEPIALQRLMIEPQAARCLDCQRAYEHRFSFAGA